MSNTPADAKTGYRAPQAPGPGEFADARIHIIATRWNVEVVDALVQGAREALLEWGVTADNIVEIRAPGAYELPLACEALARGSKTDAMIAMGAVIKGDTPHFDYVAGECARGLQDVALKHAIPVGFGVLTVNTEAQARERCKPGKENKGYEAAQAVLEMLRIVRNARG